MPDDTKHAHQLAHDPGDVGSDLAVRDSVETRTPNLHGVTGLAAVTLAERNNDHLWSGDDQEMKVSDS